MTTETELRTLCERIGQMSARDQVQLLEMVLAENRRLWAEEVARQQAATLAFLEHEKWRRATPAGEAERVPG